MPKSSSDVYVKFKIDKDKKFIDAFYIDADLERVNEWIHPSSSLRESTDREEIQIGISAFSGLGHNLINKTNVFRKTVPYIMSRMPVMIGATVENRFKKQLISKGTLITETAEYQTFAINNLLFSNLRNELSRIRALMDGLEVVPNLFLIGLIASYDAFFTELIRSVLLSKPEIISSSDKNISFKDLIELGSIDAAREKIIDREIDQTMRGSHIDQIVWLENKTNLKIREKNDLWPKFVEICERRNLFTHTEGRVSSQYLHVCSQNGHNSSHKLGDEIGVNQEYFSNSVVTLLEFGIKLYQVVWRKLLPAELEQAEEEMHETCFEMLMKKEYAISANLLKFALDDMKRFHKESTRKMMVVNRAIAEKELGNYDQATSILDKEDWSAVGENYRIAIHAVRNENEQVINLLASAAASGNLTISNARIWPAFNNIRKTPEFSDKFKEVYGEDLIPSVPIKMEGFEIEDRKEE